MTAVAREMASTGLTELQCERRLRDRRIITRKVEAERREKVRRVVDRWSSLGCQVALFDREVTDLAEAHEQHKRGVDALMERLNQFTSPSEAPSPPRAAEDAGEQGRTG